MSLDRLPVTQWVFMSGGNTLPDVVTLLIWQQILLGTPYITQLLL